VTPGTPVALPSGMWVRVDVVQEGDQLVVAAELPGVVADEVQIRAGRRVLSLRGRRRAVGAEPGAGRVFHRRECAPGSFERDVPLPVEIDPDSVDATLQDGVLVARLAVVKEPEPAGSPRRVPVGGGVRSGGFS